MKYWSTERPSRKFESDRRLDDLARRLGHQAAHAGELAHLLRGAARARVGHHEDRVEARHRAVGARRRPTTILGADRRHQLLRELARSPSAQMSTTLL